MMTDSSSTAVAHGGVRLPPFLVIVAVLALAIGAWIASTYAMVGMSGAPGVALGPVGWFVGFWVVMMAAMMLPSAWPMVLAHADMAGAHSASRRQAALSCLLFVLGYLVTWAVYGLAAWLLYNTLAKIQPDWLTWEHNGSLAAGLMVAAVGLYQLTPFKNSCLKRCIRPSSFIIHYWQPGLKGALRMGLVHGFWCMGCCLGLMLLMFLLGIMSLVWMAVVTALVFAEKILPYRVMPRLIAVFCIALGLAIAVAPSHVMELGNNPGPAMEMKMGGGMHGMPM